ncbi:MAG TPA: DUF3048 domain-containing protein [Acidimicrobiia bacterium]
MLTVAIAALVLGACSSAGSQQSKPKPPASTTTTTHKAVRLAPLTGLPDPSGAALRRQSLGVKIENTPDARPQTGLDQADIVYEEVVEGGITRFWSFFNSTIPEIVGPVRSVRSMDPNIILPFGGVVAFSGGTPDNVALVRATGLVTVDENNAGAAYYREPSRAAPHNLYAHADELLAFGGEPVPPVRMFEYVAHGDVFSGEAVASFHVGLQQGYDVSYVWDSARKRWNRFSQGTEPFLATGSTAPVQVAPTNVIVQLIPYGSGADGDVMGTGEALVFSNSQLVRGTWSKAFPGAPTQFTDAAGAPIAITPGRTWIELAPIGTVVDIVPGTPAAEPSTTTTTTR